MSQNYTYPAIQVAAAVGGATSANQVLEIADLDAIKISVASLDTKLTNPLPVSNTSLPLPAGASTSALQTTGNTSLNSIDTKTPALGQALAAASVPIVLTAAQISTLTPLSSVTVTQATGTNLHVVLDASSAVIGHVITDAGSAIIGKVGIDQTTPGTTNLVALAANQSVNNTQINGVTPLMGNGVTGTGSQRVTIASDNTAFSVNATATPTKGTLTDNSGTCSATPSTATTLMASNASRKYLCIKNTSTAVIWINFTTTAVASQPSIPLQPYETFLMESSFVSTEAVSVISTTASAPYSAKQA